MIATQGHRQLTVSFMLSNTKNNANFTSALHDGVSPADSPPAQDLTLSHLHHMYMKCINWNIGHSYSDLILLDVQMIEDAFVDAYLKVHYVW